MLFKRLLCLKKLHKVNKAVSFIALIYCPDLDLENSCCWGDGLHNPECLQLAFFIITGTLSSQFSQYFGFDDEEIFLASVLLFEKKVML